MCGTEDRRFSDSRGRKIMMSPQDKIQRDGSLPSVSDAKGGFLNTAFHRKVAWQHDPKNFIEIDPLRGSRCG